MTTELTTQSDLHNQIQTLTAEIEACGQDKAIEFASVMLGSYPKHNIEDAKVYTRAIVSVFSGFPASVCSKAVDQITKQYDWPPARSVVFKKCQAILETKTEKLKTFKTKLRAAEQAELDKKREADMKAERERFKANNDGKTPLEVLADIRAKQNANELEKE